MTEAFAVGDVVQLKSGGKPWVIEKVDGDVISCYRDDGKKIQKADFAAGTLKRHVPLKPFIKAL